MNKSGDEYNTCPECGRIDDVLCHHMGKDHFVACHRCRIFWYIGQGLITSYEELVYSGNFDEEVGGPENRVQAIIQNDHETHFILETYEMYEL